MSGRSRLTRRGFLGSTLSAAAGLAVLRPAGTAGASAGPNESQAGSAGPLRPILL